MSYVGNKPPQETVMPDNSVTSAMIVDGTITSADMAVDPRNATNLNAGDVPLAQLDNVDTSGIISNRDDIALLGFKVASNGSLAKYNLVDQTVDDFQDDSGVNTSSSTNEVRDSSGNYYSGQIASVAGSSVHTAVGAATWTCPTDIVSADILVVAGGGGGGGSDTDTQTGGGAGGGGIVHHATYTTVPAVIYDLTVGDKGSKGTPSSRDGTDGGNSSFNDNDEGSQSKMTAIGGGFGGADAGSDGGSGGGGGRTDNAGGSGTQGDSGGGTGYGNDGGHSYSSDSTGGGGGGGAGGEGLIGTSNTGGDAGAGQLFSDFTTWGVSGYFAGGGGGGGSGAGGAGAAGSGGGGIGGEDDGNGASGTVNTGGGGGGGGGVGDGGDGGTGTVIIQWSVAGAVNNMTLISATQAAQAAPTKGDIVLTYTNSAGTTTLDTDLTAEISADGGSTWTALALGSEGSTGSHNIATSHDVTISSTITAPWNMAYRIKTLNQSVSKITRIQAVSLGWS